MKERKPNVDRKENTKEMLTKEQLAISRLRSRYTRAFHGPREREREKQNGKKNYSKEEENQPR
jgi:hypothetical protein